MSDVFISYSRVDQPFVRRLHEALDSLGFESWVDWEGIPPTAEWVREIEGAIEGSDSFLFVISPDSTRSPVCISEIEHAAKLGKRLVPIVYRPVAPELVPEPIRFHNWILFEEHADFDAAIATLDTALHLDLEWVHEHTRLLVRAVEWDQHGRDRSFVLRGRDLQEADRQLSLRDQQQPPQPTPLQTEYLGASHHAATRGTRLKLTALTTALAVAIGLGIVAFVQRQAAQHQAAVAQAASLVSGSTAVLPADPELSLLLARQAMKRAPGAQPEQVLRQALDSSYVRETIAGSGPAAEASFSPDGRQVIVAYSDGDAIVWNRGRRAKSVAVLKRAKTVVTSAAFSPDGTRAVTGGDDGAASVWDLKHQGQPLVLTGHTGSITSAVFSPDGTRIVTSSTDGTARIWDAQQGGPALVVLSGHAGSVNRAAFSPDGTRVVTAGEDGTARVWDSRQGGPPLTVLDVNGGTGSVISAGYSPDGTQIVTASASHIGSDAPAGVWSAATGQLLFVLQGKAANVNAAQFSPDGTQIVTAGFDSTVRVWDASQPAPPILTLNGHRGPVSSARFGPGGANVVSAGQDGTVRIWDIRPNGQRVLVRLSGFQHTIFDAVVSHDGSRVAAASNDDTARIWDARQPSLPPVVLRGHTGPVVMVAFSRDGTRIATASADKTARVWDTAGVAPPVVLSGHTDVVNAVDFSPDGRRIATASSDGTARVWDARTGQQLFSLPIGQTGVTAALFDVSFSPNGQQIAVVGQGGIAQIWPATRKTDLPAVVLAEADEGGSVNSVLFTGDGNRVLTALDNGTAEVWDPRQRSRPLLTLTGHVGYVNDAEPSPDGRLIVTAGGDGTTRVWNATTGQALSVFHGQPGGILSATFTPTGDRIISASDGGSVDQWTCQLCVSTDRLLQLAKQRSSRSLTSAELKRYVG